MLILIKTMSLCFCHNGIAIFSGCEVFKDKSKSSFFDSQWGTVLPLLNPVTFFILPYLSTLFCENKVCMSIKIVKLSTLLPSTLLP